ncbi:MAG: PAS domain S-box protein [Bacteroidetes bacterium]|nr:PAS domain S-box protein [Bacteroidota bacterium]
MKKTKVFYISLSFILIFFGITLYFWTQYNVQTPHFTDEELQWLRNHHTIRISPNPNFPPVDFLEGDTLHSGVAGDILREVANLLNIKYTIVRYSNQAEIYEGFKKNETDVLPALVISEERKQFMLFSQPLIYLQNVIVVRKNDTTISSISDLRGKTLAVTRASVVHSRVQNDVPDVHLLLVNSGLESLFEVSFGRADAAILNLASAVYLITKHDLANLKVATDYSERVPIAIGIRPDWHIFQSILNKAINAIPQKRKDEILNKWLGLQVDIDWWSSVPWKVFTAVGLLLLLITILSLIWNRSLQQLVQKQTTQLQESEERFRQIFTDAPAGVAMIDTDYRIIQTNAAFADILGLTPAQLKGAIITDYVHHIDRDAVKNFFLTILTEKYPNYATLEYRCIHHDSSIRWVESSVRLLYTHGKSSSHFLVVSIDSTKRKHIEESNLRYTRELTIIHTLEQKVNSSLTLEKVIDYATTGILEASNAELVLLFLKEGFELKLTKIVPELEAEKLASQFPIHKVGACICGLAVRERIPIYSRNIFHDNRCTWEECKQAGIISFAAIPLIVGSTIVGVLGLARRTEYDFEANSRFLETLANTVAFGIQNSILYTTIVRTEESLRKRERELHSIFKASPIGIGVLASNRFVTVNERFCELTGYTQDELLTLELTALFPSSSEYHLILDAIRQKVLRTEIATIESRIQRKDKTILNVIISLTLIDQEQQQSNIIFTLQDITTQKILAHQLAEAQKLESLGTLAGGIAHDFNNILNIIGAYTDRLILKWEDKEQREKATSIIKSSVERAAKLVDQILTFARKTHPDFKPIHVNSLIDELVKMLRETFPRTIEFYEELATPIPKVLGNHTQLHQALLNVAINARDAMPKGGILTFMTKVIPYDEMIQVFPKAQQSTYLKITIEDTGIGMDSHTLQRIFEPFFTTKEVGKGTGLGLAVVYGIVSTHNGFIDVKSTPGKGTAFSIFLPTLNDAMHEDDTKASHSSEHSGILSKRASTILVVEDEEPLRDILCEILIGGGYSPLTAENGKVALEIYRERSNEIDLVFSDLGLPKMNGFEFFQELQKLNPGIKMVIASGYFEPSEKQKMLQSGILGFIQKPYSPSQVLSLLNELL